MKRLKGTGTVKEVGGKFYARWRIGGQDIYGPSRETLDAAEEDRINRKPESKATHISNRAMPTLAEFARMCMDEEDPTFGWYGKSLKDASYDTNVTHLECHLVGSKLGEMKLNAVTSIDVEDWVRNIQARKWHHKDGKLIEHKVPASPAYKRRCHAFVCKIFNVAKRHKILTGNPASGVELPKVAARRNVHISDEQLRDLYKCTCRTGSLMTVAAETGLRRGELVEIKWEHLSKDGLVVVNHKNDDQEDLIPISQTARDAIERQPRLSEWVFCTSDGKQLTTRNLNRDVRALMEKLGFPKETRLHDLRGKFMTDLILSGADIKTTQTLARHSNPATTMKFYLRTTEADQRKALERLAEKRGVVDRGS